MPWPTDPKYDPQLLAEGDRRNVEDKYRYWTVQAIKEDMASMAIPLEIAIENWQHDINIGTIVRSANAFNVAKVHIVGRRQWNQRGAMVTNRYMEVVHHKTVEDFVQATAGKEYIAVDNVKGATPLNDVTLPLNSILVFGGEGPGVSEAMLQRCKAVVMIEQFGSTRSVNVGVAAGILMYEWRRQHQLL